ncbi:MAG TPA: DUF924 family protein [Alphaproteobacteria bacterium]|nr:DUF924 domain-containing protein [Micavibrio sp.]MBK9561594.1 DUF924 domain-containing protein [Micavibrio sp.]HQX27429.1 DUF924 family protein [Alphaproteobacteria bacterium]
MRDTRQEITHFWFEETEPRLWFQRSDEFDSIIKDRFAMTYNMAKDGLCNGWNVDADGCLALCLLLDQFPRRMFRGTAAEFETDERALLIAKQAISKGFDQVLSPEKRFFLYIPFEHSERLSDQKKNLELFKSMQDENPVAHFVAQQRYAVIEKYGRYPERNAAMGRENTPEEKAYLVAKNSF